MITLTTKRTNMGIPEAHSVAHSKAAPLSVQFFYSGDRVLDVPPPVCFHGPGPSVGKLQDQAFYISAKVMSLLIPHISISTHKHFSNSYFFKSRAVGVPASFSGLAGFLLHKNKTSKCMIKNNAPRNWVSMPASRCDGNNFLSAIEVGPGGTIFFSTYVEPLDSVPDYHLVKHFVGAINRAIRIQEYWEQKGVLPW